jgi:hypothetical protein
MSTTARDLEVRYFECLWGVCVCVYIEEEERFLVATLLGMTALPTGKLPANRLVDRLYR